MTLAEIGQRLGADEEKVRQIETNALRKLRRACNTAGIEPTDVVNQWGNQEYLEEEATPEARL